MCCHQPFPQARPQMYCHRVYGKQCATIFAAPETSGPCLSIPGCHHRRAAPPGGDGRRMALRNQREGPAALAGIAKERGAEVCGAGNLLASNMECGTSTYDDPVVIRAAARVLRLTRTAA